MGVGTREALAENHLEQTSVIHGRLREAGWFGQPRTSPK